MLKVRSLKGLIAIQLTNAVELGSVLIILDIDHEHMIHFETNISFTCQNL